MELGPQNHTIYGFMSPDSILELQLDPLGSEERQPELTKLRCALDLNMTTASASFSRYPDASGTAAMLWDVYLIQLRRSILSVPLCQGGWGDVVLRVQGSGSLSLLTAWLRPEPKPKP